MPKCPPFFLFLLVVLALTPRPFVHAVECQPIPLVEQAVSAPNVVILELLHPASAELLRTLAALEGGIPGQAWQARVQRILKSSDTSLALGQTIIFWIPGEPRQLPLLHTDDSVLALLIRLPNSPQQIYSTTSQSCLPPFRNLTQRPLSALEEQRLLEILASSPSTHCTDISLATALEHADAGLIGTALMQEGSSWVFHPLVWHKIDQLPLADHIHVTSSTLHINAGRCYLLIVTRQSSGRPSQYETLAHNCSWGSRDIERHPLTSQEKAVLSHSIPHRDLLSLSQTFCRKAGKLIRLFDQGKLQHPAPSLLSLVQSAAQACGISWCDPAFCH